MKCDKDCMCKDCTCKMGWKAWCTPCIISKVILGIVLLYVIFS